MEVKKIIKKNKAVVLYDEDNGKYNKIGLHEYTREKETKDKYFDEVVETKGVTLANLDTMEKNLMINSIDNEFLFNLEFELNNF